MLPGTIAKTALILRIPANLVKAFLHPQNIRTLHWERTRFRVEDIMISLNAMNCIDTNKRMGP
jgi:hypothetical protein